MNEEISDEEIIEYSNTDEDVELTDQSTIGGSRSVPNSSPTPVARLTKRPKSIYWRFTQQQIPGYTPILTPRWFISAFMILTAIFVPIGVASLLASRDVVEIIDQYETECIPPSSRVDKVRYIQSSVDKTCNRTLKVTENMTQPIFVYYELDNYYQNYRSYVNSRSINQLRDPGKERDTKYCEPETTVTDKNNVKQIIVPCGLIAWSLFNDTYSFSLNGQRLPVNKTGISWRGERDHKFGSNVYPKNFQNGSHIGGAHLNESIPILESLLFTDTIRDQVLTVVLKPIGDSKLSQQEDLMVWMRTAALPTFRKLYGGIEQDLKEGDVINVTLQNNYNTYSFDGKKKLVLSTATWIGGKNDDFIGIAFLTIGGLCFILTIVFTIMYRVKPRRLGDPSSLSWNRNPGGH